MDIGELFAGLNALDVVRVLCDAAGNPIGLKVDDHLIVGSDLGLDQYIKEVALASVFPKPTLTYPTSNLTGVSLTPTLTSAEGVSRPFILSRRNGTDQTGVGVNTDLIFNEASDEDIHLDTSTGIFTLKAGLEYVMTAGANLTTFSGSTAFAYYRWVFSADNTPLPLGQSGSIIPSTFTSNSGSQPVATATLRPSVDTGVKLRVWQGSGTCLLAAANSWATVQTSTSRFLDYTSDKSQFQIKTVGTSQAIYDSGEVSGITHSVSTALPANTALAVRVRHRDVFTGNWTSWTDWVSFTTA